MLNTSLLLAGTTRLEHAGGPQAHDLWRVRPEAVGAAYNNSFVEFRADPTAKMLDVFNKNISLKKGRIIFVNGPQQHLVPVPAHGQV